MYRTVMSNDKYNSKTVVNVSAMATVGTTIHNQGASTIHGNLEGDKAETPCQYTAAMKHEWYKHDTGGEEEEKKLSVLFVPGSLDL